MAPQNCNSNNTLYYYGIIDAQTLAFSAQNAFTRTVQLAALLRKQFLLKWKWNKEHSCLERSWLIEFSQ
jgi:hypothetical protein